MSDPFRQETNQQLMREARIGLTILLVTLAVFIYMIYYRLTGGSRLPEHVRNAPVAQSVWPGEPAPAQIASRGGASNVSDSNHFDPLPRDSVNGPFGTLQQERPGPDSDLVSSHTYSAERVTSPLHVNELRGTTTRSSTPDTNDTPVPNASDSAVAISENKPHRISGQQQIPIRVVGPGTSISGLESSPPIPDPIATDPPVAPVRDSGHLNSLNSSTNQLLTRVPIDTKSIPAVRTQVLADPGESNSQIATVNHESRDNTKVPLEAAGKPEIKKRQSSQPDANQFQPPSEAVTPVVSNNSVEQTPLRDPFTEPTKPVTGTQANRGTSKNNVEAVSYVERPGQEEGSGQKEGSGLTVTEHKVQTGESIWSIAQNHYEDGRLFRALYAYNQAALNDDRLEGKSIKLPPLDELRRLWPHLCPQDQPESETDRRIYLTRPGDTLFGIARQQLGQAPRYVEIIEANRFRLPANATAETPLRPNLRLVLPR